jgi:hypothetical protein
LARLVEQLVATLESDASAPQRALARKLVTEFKAEYRHSGVDTAALLARVPPENEADAKQWRALATGYVMGRVLERADGDEGADLAYRATGLGALGKYAMAAGTLTNESKVWSGRPQAYNEIDKLFAHVETKFANWQIGKDNFYWGPGYGGAMLIADSAPSFLTLQGEKRFKIPLLGRILFTQFVGTFEEPDGRKYVVARRIERTVGRRFSWAIAEAYKSDTSQDILLALVLPLYLYGNQILDESVKNSEQLNYLANIQFTYAASNAIDTYLDFLLDDVTGFIGDSDDVPRKIGFLLGVHLRRPFGSERTDIRIEYTLTDGDDPEFPEKPEGGTYLHRNPLIAWFRDGLPIAHRIANNRRGPFVRVRHQLTPKWLGILEWEDEEQYRSTPVVGDRDRWTLYTAYDLAPDTSVALRIDRLRGAVGNDTLWQIQAAYSF